MNQGGTDIPLTDRDPIVDLRFKIDGLVKSPKKANFQILRLIISIGYEIEI
jgi:hypothetical protein